MQFVEQIRNRSIINFKRPNRNGVGVLSMCGMMSRSAPYKALAGGSQWFSDSPKIRAHIFFLRRNNTFLETKNRPTKLKLLKITTLKIF